MFTAFSFGRIFVAALILLLPYAAQGQERAGVLQGVVKDASGAPVAGAFVKMKNEERRLTFMIVSQAQGRALDRHLSQRLR